MPEHREEPSIAAAHALHLADLVTRWGVTAEDLFAGTGLDAEALVDPKARVSVAALEQLATRATALTGEPGLGFYLGLQVPISSHGYVGFAAMASSTLGDALDVAVRFAPTRTNAIAFRAHLGGEAAAVVLEELCPLGAARELVVFSLLVGLQHVAEGLTGKRMEGAADFALPEPPYIGRFRHLVRGGMRFGQPENQLVFPASALSLPLSMADPVALRLARDQCQRELDELGAGASAAARVRSLMNERRRAGGFVTLDETARALGLSTRTLKRRLADEGTDFTTLLDEQRRQRALLLLRSADLSVEAVAEQVGYSDVANFSRAFRRWSGTTPTAYRRDAPRGKRA
jgi:AraC-like DNA-binding protein